MTEREQRFYEAQAERFVLRLDGLRYAREQPLSAVCAVTPEPVPFAGRMALAYGPVAEGEVWGRNWVSGWFRLTGRIPEDWAGGYVVARLDFGSEGCLFDQKGIPRGGLSCSSIFDPRSSRDTLDLVDPAAGGEVVDLWVEAAANDLFGMNQKAEPGRHDPLRYGTFQANVGMLRIALVDKTIVCSK